MGQASAAAVVPTSASQSAVRSPQSALNWTPRAAKLAREAGLDPAALADIPATGPGGSVSGDDVARYLAACDGAASPIRKSLGIDMKGDATLNHSLAIHIRAKNLLSHHDKGQAERYIFIVHVAAGA